MSKIAVLGYGVVGSGTVELFYKNKDKSVLSQGKTLISSISSISVIFLIALMLINLQRILTIFLMTQR